MTIRREKQRKKAAVAVVPLHGDQVWLRGCGGLETKGCFESEKWNIPRCLGREPKYSVYLLSV